MTNGRGNAGGSDASAQFQRTITSDCLHPSSHHNSDNDRTDATTREISARTMGRRNGCELPAPVLSLFAALEGAPRVNDECRGALCCSGWRGPLWSPLRMLVAEALVPERCTPGAPALQRRRLDETTGQGCALSALHGGWLAAPSSASRRAVPQRWPDGATASEAHSGTRLEGAMHPLFPRTSCIYPSAQRNRQRTGANESGSSLAGSPFPASLPAAASSSNLTLHCSRRISDCDRRRVYSAPTPDVWTAGRN